MRLQIAIPEQHVTAPVLNGALEALTRLNQQMIKTGDTPTSEQLIAQGARWQPEPPGQEHFDHGAMIAKRGWGDCDDWAPLRAATLRVTGTDPGARAVVRKSGPKRWHATVIRSDGTEDDPSLDAGMPGPARRFGTRGAWVPLMQPAVHGVNGTFIATPHLALRPVADRRGRIESWQARTDLPWHGWEPGDNPSDLAMVTLHQSPVSSQAITGALNGAFNLGVCNGADPEHLKYVAALADACEGMPWEELAQRYGEQHATAAGAIVGSFFGKAFKKLGRIVKKVASPLAKGALSLVPGGGLASAALSMASPALKKSVAKNQHAPPQLRAQALRAAPAPMQQRPPAPPAPGAPAGANWLPYPYPLPYPVPGWAAQNAEQPGVAWPRG